MAPSSALARPRVATRLTRSSSIKQREEEESQVQMEQDISIEQDTTLRQSTSSASSIIDHGPATPEIDNTAKILSPVASAFSSSMASSRSKRKASDDASSLSKSVRQRRTSNNNTEFNLFQGQDDNLSMSLPASPSIRSGRKGSLFMSVPASSAHQLASFPHSAGATFDVSVLSPPSSSTYHYPMAEDYAFFPGSTRDFPLSAPAGLDAAALEAWNGPYGLSFSTPPKQSTAAIPAIEAFNLTPPDEQQFAPFANPVASGSDDAMSLFASQVRRQAAALSLSETDPMPESPSARLAFSPRTSPPQPQASPSPSAAKRTIAPLKRSSVSRPPTASNVNATAVPPLPSAQPLASPIKDSLSKSMPAEKRNHNKKSTPGKINRPPNAWILYRSDRLKELKGKPEIAGMPQATLSQLLSHAWHSEPNNVRDYYNKAADRKKAEHMALYPDYKYNPKKKNLSSSTSTQNYDRYSTPSPEHPDKVIPYYDNKRPQSSTAPANDEGEDLDIPVPSTPIGDFVPSFDPALLGLPVAENTLVYGSEGRACPPSLSPVKQISSSTPSRQLTTPLKTRSRIPVPVSKNSAAVSSKAELFKQNASSFAQQQGLNGKSRASPAASRVIVPSTSRTPSRMSQSTNAGGHMQNSQMRLSTPSQARQRSFAKSPSITASGSRSKTVPRYQQPTASSMARSVTHPPASTSPQHLAYGPISPTAVEQASMYSHIQHPVPRPVHGSETFLSIEELFAGLTNAPSQQLLFQEVTDPYGLPSIEGSGLSSSLGMAPSHQLYQTPEGATTVAGNLGGHALQHQAQGAYDQFQQNHIFTFYPAQTSDQPVQLVQQPQMYQQAPPQLPTQLRRGQSSPRKVSASMRAYSQQPAAMRPIANHQGLSAPTSSSMYRANSSPAAPFAATAAITQPSVGQDGFVIDGVFYPSNDAHKMMTMAYQAPSASVAADPSYQEAIPTFSQPGIEYVLMEQAPDGTMYQSKELPRLAEGSDRQGNDSFEQYLTAPSMMEMQPVSAMLHTPDTGSTGFQGYQYMPTEDGSVPFLANLDDYGLPSATSYIAEYGGSLPPSAVDPSFQAQNGQGAPTMFIAETGEHFSLTASVGSNGSGGNFSTVDPSDLTIIEHPSSDSLATDGLV